MSVPQITFDVKEAAEGGFIAASREEAIATQGETWDELRENIRDATEFFFEDVEPRPASVRIVLHLEQQLAA